ncbi:lamin tail domain-containing protein [candidate division KSB1 bacterium]|nr:lamin tail domain-containing protein [candidate division KSB1 bacterium]
MRKLVAVVAPAWLLAAFLVAPLAAQDHLLITEFAVTPTAGEFIEIYNPTDQTIDLTNYYITDATFPGNPPAYYYNTVLGNGGGGSFADFNARFPAGTSIAPGAYQTIALNGSNNFMTTYSVAPTYELYEDAASADNIPDMLEATTGSINRQGGLTDNGEAIILFYWDGTSNLVKDVDYVVWGDKVEAVDKTGVTINNETYLDDTPIADQTVVNADNDADENPHNPGMSAQRRLDVEDLEIWTGGNGITGHNETSENISWKGGIWSINEPATPGRRALSPKPAADSLTVADVQFIRADDIGSAVTDDSPFTNDTLTVTAMVMHGMREIFLGNRWGAFLEDARGGPWSGFFVIQNDTSSPGVSGTNLTAAQPGDIIRITGIMSEFPTGQGLASITQFVMITDPVTPIDFVDFSQPLPAPILLKPGDLGLTAAGNSADPQLSERWESVLARFENLTVLANNLPGNTMTASDETGTIVLDDYFNSVSTAITNNGGVWPGFPAGTKINVTGFVRGGTTGGQVTINPRTLQDIEVAAVPPNITAASRTPVAPTSAQGVTISANILDADGTVASASIVYNVDRGSYQTVAMTTTNDTSYIAVIPAQANGAFVQYFIKSTDNQGNASSNPPDTSAAKFFYFVKDAGLAIRDVQFTPFRDGRSGYVGAEVTITGTVTSTKDYFNGGFIFTAYYLQDDAAMWSGIQVFDPANSVTLGDNVTVTGTVQENFSLTRLNVTSFTRNSSGNPVPAPVVVTTGEIATNGANAEAYESVLVEVRNVTVTVPFSDGGQNFGEFSVSDGTGNLRIDDESGHAYSQADTMWKGGEKIAFIRGIHHFHNNNFKIQPRNNDDLGPFTVGVQENPDNLPRTFALEQNYPNPFWSAATSRFAGNPETIIKYQLPKQAVVSINIFNILGQKVRTLVDNVQPAGAYSIRWDGANDRGVRVPSGVYFYQMKSADFVKMHKMLLLK